MAEPQSPAPRPSKRYGPKVMLGAVAVVAMIAAFEGGTNKDGSSVVYADKLAQGLPTVCHGLTRHITTTPIIVGEKWSAEKCFKEEQTAIMKVQGKLEWCFSDIPPPQSVFDAATSFAWNNGVGATCASRSMAYWNGGNWNEGCRSMAYASGTSRPVWSYVKTGKRLANGKPEYAFVKGLFKRRNAEFLYCMKDLTK